MTDERNLEVDLDQEKVLFESAWFNRDELAEKIKKMIENQDFRISATGSALEFLENALVSARSFEVKLTGLDAERLEQHADRAAVKPGAFIRQALMAYLAAQPPLAEDEAPASVPPLVPLGREESDEGAPSAPTTDDPAATAQVLTTVTTEPAGPEDESQAVELTDKKTSESSPVVDPSAQSQNGADSSAVVGDSWFKKR